MAAPAATARAQAGWVCRPFGTGFCGSTPVPAGLVDGKAPGQAPRLDQAQRDELAQLIEAGPIPAVHGVVRWQLSDLAQWMMERYRTSVSEQTLSLLRTMGYRKLSARPRLQNPQAAADFKKRMARPVRKQFWRSDLTSLHQRIRPMGISPGQDGALAQAH